MCCPKLVVNAKLMAWRWSDARIIIDGSSCAWLGIPIFGSNFWDPHWKQISDPFLIPKILVGIFLLNSAVEKSRYWNSDFEFWNSK
jgi:hypothetical protein